MIFHPTLPRWKKAKVTWNMTSLDDLDPRCKVSTKEDTKVLKAPTNPRLGFRWQAASQSNKKEASGRLQPWTLPVTGQSWQPKPKGLTWRVSGCFTTTFSWINIKNPVSAIKKTPWQRKIPPQVLPLPFPPKVSQKKLQPSVGRSKWSWQFAVSGRLWRGARFGSWNWHPSGPGSENWLMDQTTLVVFF